MPLSSLFQKELDTASQDVKKLFVRYDKLEGENKDWDDFWISYARRTGNWGLGAAATITNDFSSTVNFLKKSLEVWDNRHRRDWV